MRFDANDETAFYVRRNELCDQFARWLETHRVAGEPGDANLLMDWKFGYGDGELGTWTTADVGEFLFRWCPHKLSAPQRYLAKVPSSVAAFVEFLAHTGMLAPGSGRPFDIRRYCQRNADRFLQEMNCPPLDGDAALEGIAALLKQLHETSPNAARELQPEVDVDEDEPRSVGPVRLPDADERRAAIRAAEDMPLLRALAEHCRHPDGS
jgi:hypothetical protein